MYGLDIVLCIFFICLWATALYCAYTKYTINKKHEAEVGMLKAQIANMQERWIWLEERYAKHEAKYHR